MEVRHIVIQIVQQHSSKKIIVKGRNIFLFALLQYLNFNKFKITFYILNTKLYFFRDNMKIRLPDLVRQFSAEVLGTFLLVLFGDGAIAQVVLGILLH